MKKEVYLACVHNVLLFLSGEPLKIINNPKSLSSVSPGTAVSFTVQATEMDPLSYQWQWKPLAEEEDEWQPCRAEWCDGATLNIPSVQKYNEGSYRCVISTYAGTLISKSAQLTVGKKKMVFAYLAIVRKQHNHVYHFCTYIYIYS